MDREQLDTIDMSEGTTEAETMSSLIEHIMGAVKQHRRMAMLVSPAHAVHMDTTIMSALVVAAGCVHGEMVGMGLVEDDIQPDALNKMLQGNFAAGDSAGRAKVQRIKAVADETCVDPTCPVHGGRVN